LSRKKFNGFKLFFLIITKSYKFLFASFDFSLKGTCSRNNFTRLVIPDLIEPAPYLIWGNPVFSVWVPVCLRQASFRGNNKKIDFDELKYHIFSHSC